MGSHVPIPQGDFDKVTLITGGSKGLGRGCAEVFVEAGATVVICARNSVEGETTASELTALGPGACSFIQCDVTNTDEMDQLIQDTVALHGRLDCLINNAGWHPDRRPIDEFSIEEFEDLLRLNLVSCFAGCKFALPYLRQVRGNIINMSSLVGAIGQDWATIYVATKGGITALTKALAIDEARHGVRVNAVLPGTIYTPGVEQFIQAWDNPPDYRAYLESWEWLGRMGTPRDAGYACLFLASDEAAFITGVELNVSGGAELGYGMKLPREQALAMIRASARLR